jgi:subtilisin family serine protease
VAQHQHLPLRRLEGALERRQHGFGKIPNRDAKAHGGNIVGRIEALVEGHKEKPKVADIDPALILKVQTVGAIPEETWNSLGMTLLADELDMSLILFANDTELKEFRRRLAEYLKDPPDGQKNPHYANIFSVIENVSELTPADRIGPVLRSEGKADPADFEAEEVLDIELWQPGADSVLNFVARVQKVLGDHGGAVINEYKGQHMTLVRARANGNAIRALLQLSEVFSIDRPPQPDLPLFDVSSFQAAQLGPVTRPAASAPIIGVIDSGLNAGHPLLEGTVAASFAVPETLGDADERGHGTPVSGLSVYGDVRLQVEQGAFIGHFKVASAKVVDAQGHFSSDLLVPTQMEAAIRRLHTLGCNVINISLGDPRRVAGVKPSPWAAVLDTLVRELDLIIVVSAGNRTNQREKHGDGVVGAYPGFLWEPESRILEPATAVNALTVGSLAHSNGLEAGDAEMPGVVPFTEYGYPSPFTRVGPGVNKIIKPDFVDFGGTLVFDGPTQRLRGGEARVSSGVISLHHNYLDRMLTAVSGTSFAAPVVAYKAGLVREILPESSANLVRALLAISAEQPPEARDCLDGLKEEQIFNVLGHGLIDAERAIYSEDHRVVLIREDSLDVDRFAVYEVPVPDIFREQRGTRRIRVALAFDPIVRHTRLDYAGLNMSFDLFRGTTAAEVFDACRKWEKKVDGEDVFKIGDARRCPLVPSTKLRGYGTLQCGSFVAQRNWDKYGETYYLAVRCHGGWASDITPQQRFAIAVELQHEAEIALYQQVQQRVELVA